MSEVIAFGQNPKYVVARPNNGSPQYLRKVGHAYAWGCDPKWAEHFDDELSAGAIANRVAGGAIAAELVVL